MTQYSNQPRAWLRTFLILSTLLFTFTAALPTRSSPPYQPSTPSETPCPEGTDDDSYGSHYHPSPPQTNDHHAANPATYSSIPPLSSYTLPLNGGPTELPAPSTGLTLKAILIGRGTQNYTCSPSYGTAPKPIGAVARLYNTHPFLATLALAGKSIPDSLTTLNALTAWEVSQNLPKAEGEELGTYYGEKKKGELLPQVGRHYFDASGVPIFDVSLPSYAPWAPGSPGSSPQRPTTQQMLFRGKKLAAIPAPASAASSGQKGEGAVDWLKLVDVGGSVNAVEVYRVETGGGKPPVSCDGLVGGEGVVVVEYVAQYWFYG